MMRMQSRKARQLGTGALLMAMVMATCDTEAFAAGGGGTLEIKVGQTIQRTWDDVKKADYVYGPKQEVDPGTKETHAWLPYGNQGVYFATAGVKLTDPGPDGTGTPLAVTTDGNTSGRLVFKLHFDRPIAAFRFAAGWSEWGVGSGTVGGVEYSIDGRNWSTLREVSQGGIVEPFVDAGKSKVTGLKTQDLYIRCYSRDESNPGNDFGPGRWMKFRMAGDPAWGDAATTFFNGQMQVWVTPLEGAASDTGVQPADDRTSKTPLTEDRTSKTSVPHQTPPNDRSASSARETDPRDDASPWAIASGAEWSGDYPKFNPMLQKAGVRWLRLFPEWQSIQPRQNQWEWEGADRMVADARANNIHLIGVWCYFTPWASADGGTRRGPVKDIQYWRDYVTGTVDRYQKDIKYWEVWNEFNGSFYEGQNKVKDYADLVVAAYDAAKKVAPSVKVGMSVANFDVGFLDAAIKAGAADHFDYLCVHPYENLAAVGEGGEVGYLSLAGNLRQMLAANKQRPNIPLWITETGFQAPIKPDARADAQQADMLVKAYLLSMAQGFDRICWFEARGPAYGQGTDHGIIRADWTPRPAYDALRTMTTLLGQKPRYLGWLDLDEGGYGFLFQGQHGGVLAAWSPAGKQHKAKFGADVSVTNLEGRQSSLEAGQELVLSQTPVFVGELPDDLATQAQANLGRPYPWGGDYAHAQAVTCRLGAANIEDGLRQVNPKTTVVANGLTDTCRRTDFAVGSEGHYVYFRVDPLFVPYGTKELEITIVAKRVALDKDAGMNLCYESAKGYRGAPGWWTIPEGDQWQQNTWTVSDANFVGQWGWNFRFDAVSSPNEFLVKEVRVKRSSASAK
ncbi:MAG: endo-1,4-beta-xylanase [Pirellulales bacterium]|nr:endo-1,4-beta-xylanase [Pirellulales bacterium]